MKTKEEIITLIKEQVESSKNIFKTHPAIHKENVVNLFMDDAETLLSILCSLSLPKREEKKWVSIQDRLPDFGVGILMHLNNGVIGCGYRSEDEKEDNVWHLYHDNLAMEDSKPTHWQALPELPSDLKEGEG